MTADCALTNLTNHFLIAMPGLQDDLFAYLQAGNRKVIDWFHRHDYAVVDFSDDDFSFANINTPDDWQSYR